MTRVLEELLPQRRGDLLLKLMLGQLVEAALQLLAVRMALRRHWEIGSASRSLMKD